MEHSLGPNGGQSALCLLFSEIVVSAALLCKYILECLSDKIFGFAAKDMKIFGFVNCKLWCISFREVGRYTLNSMVMGLCFLNSRDKVLKTLSAVLYLSKGMCIYMLVSWFLKYLLWWTRSCVLYGLFGEEYWLVAVQIETAFER